LRFLHLCDQNWVGMANAFVDAHRRHGHEARLVTLCECVNEFEEDVCLHLPLLKGTPFHQALKGIMDRLHGNRPKFEQPPDGVPVWRPRGRMEAEFFRLREELWKPRIERAIREHGLDRFDVYHLESGVGFYRDARFLRRMKARGARVVCYYLGTDLRNRGVIPAVRDLSDLDLTCEWDHLRLDPGLEYFFLPFDAGRYEYREPAVDRLRISHAPRNRWFKGTHHVMEAVERARKRVDLDFDLIEGVPHAEAMRRKRASNLLIDHVGEAGGTTGYGMNSLEALALGIPCMTSMMPEYEEFVRARASAGGHPFLVTTPGTLEDQLVELARNPGELRERSRAGRDWVEAVHGVDRIVERIYARYRELGWMDEEGNPVPSAGAAAV
jgi:glycosyltransferase involved in cell wall biosynthesis